jgi:hypothetical protein
MNKYISTRRIDVNVISDLLVSIHGYEVRLTCHPDQLLTTENARLLADTLREAADQADEEKAFDEKCQQILSALTPAQHKLLAEKLSTVKETPNETRIPWAQSKSYNNRK